MNHESIPVIILALVLFAGTADAQDASDLAKKTQNPVADLISVPFQNNFNTGAGVGGDTIYNLNIQPVIPTSINEEWNLIHRFIIPLLDVPELIPGTGSDFGFGDMQYQGFFSPADSGSLIWGVGPVIQFPTATSALLGAQEWGAGPSFVALSMKGPWVFGGLVNNVWSFDGGNSVNQLLVQPFVNYNLPGGWYLTSAPIITSNWNAPSGQKWTVPVGGGIGRVTKFGSQPVNIQAAAYHNVEHPTLGPDWNFRLQVQLLFPR
jgi:hypothetical protein